MIRTNLSTRPFYNIAAVRLWLLVAGLVVLAATAFNVTQVLRYSNSNTELVTKAAADEGVAEHPLEDPIQQVYSRMWRPRYPQIELA